MRIALIAPIYEPCPPTGYGGIELVVSLLADRLVAAGHDVTLFATGDSRTTADLRFREPKARRTLRQMPRSRSEVCEWQGADLAAEMLHIADALRSASEFDIIHNHAGYGGISMANLVDTPVVSTLHGPFTDDNRGFFSVMRRHPYVAISGAQRDSGADLGLNIVGVVHNGIETSWFDREPETPDVVPDGWWKEYLLFLGRVSPEKGTHIAIEAARRTRRPLLIAGKVDIVDRAYWEEKVQPYIDGEQIVFVGEVGGERKLEVLQGALALLHPVQWPEPFGLVMPEAMACGTPVIAYPRGSVPEVVDEGVTGFICDDLDSLAEAVEQAHKLDPERIQAVCRERFDADHMTAGYLEVYRRILVGCRV